MAPLAQELALFGSSSPWIAAALILVVGAALAAVVAALVNLVARKLLENTREAGRVAGATFWVITGVTVLLAAGRLTGPRTTQLGLTDATRTFLVRLPDLFLALLIVVLAYVVAVALRSLLRRVLARYQPAAADILAPAGFWAVLVLAALVAADQIGVEVRLVQGLLLLLIGGLVLAAALALGLGSRDLVGHIVAGRHAERIVSVGDEIDVAGFRGTVTTIGHASVRLATHDGEVEIPNRFLLNEVVIVLRRGGR